MNAATTIPSAEQAAIYEEGRTGHGNLFIEACAGTGKTTSMKGFLEAAPEKLKAYVVFNKKNKKEAEGKITGGVEIRTLNGLGFRFCDYNFKGCKPDESVELDRVKQVCPRIDSWTGALTDVLGIIDWAKNTCPFAKVIDLIRIAEQKGFEPSEGDARDGGWTVAEYARVAHAAMELAKNGPDAQRRISFNDQVWLPVVKYWVRPWFELVCVDECQDLNVTQRIMVTKACKKAGRVVMVGDPRQAIYGFRGADVAGYHDSKKSLNAKVLGLTVTYRCAQAIVREAQKLVPHYQAAPGAPEGSVRQALEAQGLAEVKPGDAIVSRKGAPLMGIALQLLKAGIPARIEGRDITKLLHKIVRKCRAATVELFVQNVEAWSRKQSEKAAKGKDAERETLEVSDSAEVVIALAADCETVEEVDARIDRLFGDSFDKDGAPNPVPAVVLSTVHKAKGLEWNRVYLLEGTFTPVWSTEASEELNIKYVAITRAISELVWVVDSKFYPKRVSS